MPPNLDKREARIIATQAMVYASSYLSEENKDSIFCKLKKGETCHPDFSDSSEIGYLNFMTKILLMPKERLIASLRLHQIESRINMIAVAADFNVHPDFAMERANDLDLIEPEE